MPAKTKTKHALQVGPHFPTVSVKDFSKMRLTREQWRDAWTIVGPSVERNFDKGPLWITITAAYLEGLSHGYALALDHERAKADTPSINHQPFNVDRP